MQTDLIKSLVNQVMEYLDSVLLCAAETERLQEVIFQMIDTSPPLPGVNSWEQRADQLDALSKINLVLVLIGVNHDLPVSDALDIQLEKFISTGKIDNLTSPEIRKLVLPGNVKPLT